MSEDTSVKFGADISGLTAGVGHMSEQIEKFVGGLSGYADQFKELGEAIIAAFAVEKIVEFAEKFGELGEQAIRTSEMLGISVEEVQKLQNAVLLTGGDVGSFATSMGRFERNIADAEKGTGKAAEAFTNLGISMKDLKTLSPEDLIYKVADAFKEGANGAEKFQYAVALGGRAWGENIPFLNRGSEALKELEAQAAKTGSALTGDQAEAFAQSAEKAHLFNLSVQGLANTVFDSFRPAIDSIVEGFTHLIEGFNDSIKQGEALGVVFKSLVVTFDAFVVGVESGVILVKAAIESVWTVFKDLLAFLETFVIAVKDLFVGLKNAISDALSLKSISQIKKDFQDGVEQMKIDWKAGMDTMSSYTDDFVANVGKDIDGLAVTVAKMWASLTGAAAPKVAEGAKDKFAPLTGGAAKKDDDSLALNDIKTDEEIAKLELQKKKDSLGEQLAEQKISKAKELEVEKQYINEEFEIYRQALDQKLSLYKEGSDKYEEVLNEMDVLDKKHEVALSRVDLDIAKNSSDQIKKTQEEYKSFFSTIEKSMDTMLQGVLQGTQSWQQAMAKLFDNLALSFIEDIAKMLLKAAALKAVNLFGGEGGNLSKAIGGELPQTFGGTKSNSSSPLTAAMTALTTFLGLNTAAQTANATATSISTLATEESTATHIATTAEHIGAFLLNTVATTANTVATWVESVVTAAKPFDVGTWNAPGGLSLLHPGEIVLPPGISGAVRSGAMSIGGGGGGGGGNVTINISAIDTQSGAQFLKNNASVIAKAVAGQSRNFNQSLNPGAR